MTWLWWLLVGLAASALLTLLIARCLGGLDLDDDWDGGWSTTATLDEVDWDRYEKETRDGETP